MTRSTPTPWEQQERARKVLADIAASPPRKRYVRGILGPNDGGMIYDDPRVRELQGLYMDEQRRILAECDEAKDWTAFHAIRCVDDVIEQAISEHRARFDVVKAGELEDAI